MAGLFDKQADLYLDGRPTYPAQWYSMLADHTLHHSLAWDVGTGNGQAALGGETLRVPTCIGAVKGERFWTVGR
ncbi:hypothetical protein POTOM_027438 [Populus tomentosa]|uniref:Uncharacterized protein n=1 Tax=Populus tomentosa TaxID=118781 RepID=A0A8X8CW56_POPTO|nr:hypothetical protein POTOM_027438 [Populus tomentosa]